MVDAMAAVDNIGSAIDSAIKIGQGPLFVTGLVMGATEDLAYGGSYSGLSFSDAAQHRVADAAARMTGFTFKMPDGYQSSQGFKINWFGWANKGLAAYLVAWGYKVAGLPYSKEIYGVVAPLGFGYSVGGFFDDPIGGPAKEAFNVVTQGSGFNVLRTGVAQTSVARGGPAVASGSVGPKPFQVLFEAEQ